MKKLTLNVEGMHCKSCAFLIQDDMEDLMGVEDVEVSHETGIVNLSYDDSKIGEDRIRKIILDGGYKIK